MSSIGLTNRPSCRSSSRQQSSATPMKFRFQRRDEKGHWVDVGSAQGSGPNPAAQALEQLIGKSSRIAPGEYRYRPIDGVTLNWSPLTISSSSASSWS